MIAAVYNTPSERLVSGALALAMHLLFLLLLVFGVAWQKQELQPVMVELWDSLPPLPKPKPAPAPEVKPKPPPPAPKVEVKPAPKPEPKVEPAPAPKPDIALKEKKERERKAREQALAEKKKREQEALAEKKRQEAKALAEKKRQEAKALAEKKRREEQRIAALKAEQAKKAEVERLAREQAEARRRLAAAEAAERAKLIDEYKRRIADKIKRFIVQPPNLQGNPEVEFSVTVLPGGEVLDVKTRTGSSVAAWDSAVERAIRRAQPLPLPPDPMLMREFRELNLKFRPKE